MPAEIATDRYKKVLLQYFEEEIMGEAYFYKLAEHFPEAHQKERLSLQIVCFHDMFFFKSEG